MWVVVRVHLSFAYSPSQSAQVAATLDYGAALRPAASDCEVGNSNDISGQ